MLVSEVSRIGGHIWLVCSRLLAYPSERQQTALIGFSGQTLSSLSNYPDYGRTLALYSDNQHPSPRSTTTAGHTIHTNQFMT